MRHKTSELSKSLGISERTVRYRLKNTPRHKHTGQGGGWEYEWEDLPPDIQAKIPKPIPETKPEPLNLPKEPEVQTISTLLPIAPELSFELDGSKDQWIDAKLMILKALEAFCAASGYRKSGCHRHFSKAYNCRRIEVPGTVRDLVPTLSRSTLERWQKDLQEQGIAALSDKRGLHRKGISKIEGEVKELILAMLLEFPHSTGRHLLKALEARFHPQPEIEIPSLRTIERWVKQWKVDNQSLFASITNPDKWNSKHRSAFGSYSEGITYVNQLWEQDTTPGDVILTDGRFPLLGCVDVFSRRVSFRVVERNNANEVMLFNRDLLLHWGIPDGVKHDNGSEYKNKFLARCFAELNVSQTFCQKFSPWEKPHIEAANKSLLHGMFELLLNFIGHNIPERQAIEARRSFAKRLMSKGDYVEMKMTRDELQAFLDKWCNDYLHHPHNGLGDRTPFEILNSDRTPIKVIQDERALDILLAQIPGDGLRSVQKKGISLNKYWYIAPELGEFTGTSKKVLVKQDDDLGKIYVFDGETNGFICIAYNPELSGVSRQEIAVKASAIQKKRIQAGKKVLNDITHIPQIRR